MVVLVLSAAPASLRGSMTRWLLEVSPGVFVGHLSARVREQLWELVRAYIGEGRALLIWSVRSEHRQIEGSQAIPGAVKAPKESWSIAARRRRYRNPAERALGRQ